MVNENSSGRRSSRLSALSAELNLVPFIDLLSSLVLFLLVTAVWMQISVIPVSTKSAGAAEVSRTPSQLPERLKVHLSANGIDIIWPESAGSLTETIDKVNGLYPWEGFRSAVVKNRANLSVSYLSSDDSVPYGMVIHAVDYLKASGISSVSLKTE